MGMLEIDWEKKKIEKGENEVDENNDDSSCIMSPQGELADLADS